MNKQKQHQNNIKQTQQRQETQQYNDNDDYQLGHKNNSHQIFTDMPVQQSQSDDGEILQKIDTLLLQNKKDNIGSERGQKSKMSKKQMLLNFKINQLQKIIYNLNQSNKKLNSKLQQYYNTQKQHNVGKKINQSSASNINSSLQSNNQPFDDQLTEMQGQFIQIEHLIQQYKEQLSSSQKRWNIIKEQKDQQIESLKKEIISLAQNKQILQHQLLLKQDQIQVIRGKNQQLLLEMEGMEMEFQRQSQEESDSQRFYNNNQGYHNNGRFYENGSGNRRFQQPFEDYRFNQKIQKQMQIMIKKLLKELSNERKINSRMSHQIKRLNSEVLELQKKIKFKNDDIYQLEMKIIYLQKSNANINTNKNNMNKYSKITSPLTPTQNKRPINNRYTNSQEYQVTAHHRATSHSNRTRHNQQKQIVRQNELINNYEQYRQQNGNLQQNSYQDYVLNSIPTAKGNDNNNKNFKIQKPNQISQHQSNMATNFKNQILSSNNKNNQLYNNNQVFYNRQKQQQYISTNKQKQQIQPKQVSSNFNFIKSKKRQVQQQQIDNDALLLQPHQQNEQITIKNQNNKAMVNDGNKMKNGKSLNNKQLNNSNKQFLAFTLMQLQQGKLIKITIKQKIIIISRLIDVYCKKIRNKDYYNLIAEEIQIYNFNKKHPNLIRVRVIDAHSSSNANKSDIITSIQDDNQESLLWNMAFIVQNLVKQVQTVDRQDLQVDLNLSQIIQQILAKSFQQKICYFQELYKSLQASVA